MSSFIQNSFTTQLNFVILLLHYFKVLWVYLSIFNQAHLKCLNKCVASLNVQPHTKHQLYTANVWGFTLNTLSKPKQPWPQLLERPELTSTSMDVKQKINFILQLVLADSSLKYYFEVSENWNIHLKCDPNWYFCGCHIQEIKFTYPFLLEELNFQESCNLIGW